MFVVLLPEGDGRSSHDRNLEAPSNEAAPPPLDPKRWRCGAAPPFQRLITVVQKQRNAVKRLTFFLLKEARIS